MAGMYLREDIDGLSVGDDVSLTGSEARHAAKVARARVGEQLMVGNGRGLVVDATVVAVSTTTVELRADAVHTVEFASPVLSLVQALAKGDRDERAVESATELGVDTVTPWAADRSVVKWHGEKAAKGLVRWSAIVREASKQSLRPWLPAVEPLCTIDDIAAMTDNNRVLVLEPTAQTTLGSLAMDHRDVTIVVGPEGGISPAELDRLSTAGAELVRLGDTVLRTSSAGPAALAVVNVALGRW